MESGSTRGRHGAQHDAVEFLESGASKWALYVGKDRIARSVAELRTRAEENTNAEILGVFTASAPWYRDGRVAGFCQFRRTWCNNIVFDYLGVHPSLLSPATREFSGLGTALLYCVATLAAELKAGIVWAETTDMSANFYARLFALPALTDLLVIKSEDFLRTARLCD